MTPVLGELKVASDAALNAGGGATSRYARTRSSDDGVHVVTSGSDRSDDQLRCNGAGATCLAVRFKAVAHGFLSVTASRSRLTMAFVDRGGRELYRTSINGGPPPPPWWRSSGEVTHGVARGVMYQVAGR